MTCPRGWLVHALFPGNLTPTSPPSTEGSLIHLYQRHLQLMCLGSTLNTFIMQIFNAFILTAEDWEMPAQKYLLQGIASLNWVNLAVFTVQADELLVACDLGRNLLKLQNNKIQFHCMCHNLAAVTRSVKLYLECIHRYLPCLMLVEPWHLVNCTTTCGCLNIQKITCSF